MGHKGTNLAQLVRWQVDLEWRRPSKGSLAGIGSQLLPELTQCPAVSTSCLVGLSMAVPEQ